ncbi:energy-coupling factor ABC transporter ATP-binding protein [Clostridium sp. MSJ-11]|uniref:Energy-coupling factor ABC transporter ATP-binding protein n=1 Tax=Clostridium mobile TaxID=2841512 RepID=A0ABS6ELB3_9CLOT|nr:energy-coupling factor ABC transporter ATP-binding protein [Clostridium mobile]MBU5486015.1 energy-coupling factor ABC transporter ATP-binding protein [Clostridium mobile]
MLKVKDVSFSYTKQMPSLEHINLDIQPGECILLCGESGCGKTTLTKVINGLIPHFYNQGTLNGEVIYRGKTIGNMRMYEIAKYISSVFQNPKSQFFHTQSDAEIVFGLENEGMDTNFIKKRFQKVVSDLHVNNLTGRSVFSMSGGEKQQLAFASVYAMNPKIYVLDEPTANIDQEAIERLTEIIKKIKERGHTVIIAEHRLFFLKDIIDRAIYIRNGKIEQILNKDEFFKLSEDQRISMGLRTLHKETLCLSYGSNDKDFVNVEITGLSCGFKRKFLFKNLNLSFKEGSILGITGKNGVGKSTLCRCIAGLHKEKSGTIKWNGKPLKMKKRRALCSMVMQDVNHQLFSDSVYNECRLGNEKVSDEKIFDVLEQFDLLKYKDAHPMSLSGGQKQRLAVETSILSEKKILIFDEPTSGLDYRRMINVSKQIKSLSERGHCIMIISHDIEFLNQTCNQVFQL